MVGSAPFLSFASRFHSSKGGSGPWRQNATFGRQRSPSRLRKVTLVKTPSGVPRPAINGSGSETKPQPDNVCARVIISPSSRAGQGSGLRAQGSAPGRLTPSGLESGSPPGGEEACGRGANTLSRAAAQPPSWALIVRYVCEWGWGGGGVS